MNDSILLSLKIIFLLGFTLHNFEEAIWLPEWSKYAGKFHGQVEPNPFIFAVIIVTLIGYIITVLDIIFGLPDTILNYIYLGFIGMMGLNSIFPHLLSTIVIKKYAPGLATGIFLNLPLSILLISVYIDRGINIIWLIAAILTVSAVMLFSLKYLFRLGKALLNPLN